MSAIGRFPPASQAPPQSPWLERQVTVTPSMCGQSSLLAARIGDWTWETVSQQCGLDVQRARTSAGMPTYLAFQYFHLRGSERMHPHALGFGDTLTVRSQAFDFGSESVLTLHRLAPAGATDTYGSDGVDPDEFYRHPRPDCLYAETFNRWIRRSRDDGNTGLISASPAGFAHDHLPGLPRQYSPRAVTSSARRNGSLLADPRPGTRALYPAYTTDHQIDPVRDLNGVGLVYFAAYFSIIDSAVLAYWRHLGRCDESFLRRRVTDQKLCYFGNVDTGATISLTVRAYAPADDDRDADEVLDISARDRATSRLLAVCAIRLLRE